MGGKGERGRERKREREKGREREREREKKVGTFDIVGDRSNRPTLRLRAGQAVWPCNESPAPQ